LNVYQVSAQAENSKGEYMLAQATILTSLICMALTLWLAFYLFARGFPNLIAMRAVLSMLAVSVFFLATYNNFFMPAHGSAALLAVLLILGMTCWYSVTFQLLSSAHRHKYQSMEITIYTLAIATIALLIITKTSFPRQGGNDVFVAQLEGNPVYFLYGMTQIIIFASSFFNLLVDKKIRLTSQGRFFLFTSAFPTLAVIYGILALFFQNPPFPRLFQDFFVFSGVFMFGLSVARHKSLIERRTIFQDFPIIGVAMFTLVFVYLITAIFMGIQPQYFGLIAAATIITHSLYDLIREFLERARQQKDTLLRKKLYLLESGEINEEKLYDYLQESLELLCKNLNTTSGLIAIRKEEKLLVIACKNSAQMDSEISEDLVESDDVFQSAGKIHNIEWMTSSFEGQKPVALVGIGTSSAKLNYSAGELELFTEFADHVGTIVSIGNLRPKTDKQMIELVENANAQARDMESIAEDMLETLSSNPEERLVKVVEEGLRKYSDYIVLGQSPLAEWVGAEGNSHIERGKQVQKVLSKAIETLRPAEARPEEPLPRIWYNYVVLHDAYVKGVINREVMARLYISEGTFNRIRRNAIKGVTRWLLEENKMAGNNRRHNLSKTGI
jgi:hypothetical protein